MRRQEEEQLLSKGLERLNRRFSKARGILEIGDLGNSPDTETIDFNSERMKEERFSEINGEVVIIDGTSSSRFDN